MCMRRINFEYSYFCFIAQAPTSVAGVIGLDRNVMPVDGMEKVTTRVGRQFLITIR